MLFIGLNMFTMTLDRYDAPDTYNAVLDYLNAIFVVIFSSECLLKIFALRYHYFKEPWNLFDVVVVILSILGKYPSILLKVLNTENYLQYPPPSYSIPLPSCNELLRPPRICTEESPLKHSRPNDYNIWIGYNLFNIWIGYKPHAQPLTAPDFDFQFWMEFTAGFLLQFNVLAVN